MPQTYAFQISMPVTDTLPRNRVVNRVHFEHVAGGVADTDLNSMCADLVALYQVKYANTTHEVDCRAYDVDAVPNYPRAQVVVNTGSAWTCATPREIALVLSYCASHRGNKSERGRIYLMPQLNSVVGAMGLRPINAQMQWALDWYGKSNESFPDIGGVDWKFGVWSKTYQKFTQSTQAWCNDDWDIQRRRGLREATRLSITREG